MASRRGPSARHVYQCPLNGLKFPFMTSHDPHPNPVASCLVLRSSVSETNVDLSFHTELSGDMIDGFLHCGLSRCYGH